MLTKDQASSAADSDAPSPPQLLDYPSPLLSPFDRPVEPVVRVARTLRLVIRIVWWVFAIGAVAFGAWAMLRLLRAFESMGR
jgi:hypothetical protein